MKMTKINLHNISREFYNESNLFFRLGNAEYDKNLVEVDSHGNLTENRSGLSGHNLLYYLAGWAGGYPER